MKMTAKADRERFETDAGKYAAYLETPEGRLRLDLTFANLQELLAHPIDALCALDIGCGPGTMALRLARLGLHVTLLDSSPAMLNLAQRAAQEAGVAQKITTTLGDAGHLSDLFTTQSFDVILCHSLLEYVDDPENVLRSAAGMMRESSAILSVLVRNQAGEVLKAAIQGGNLDAAQNSLSAEWGHESLYGGRVRLFKRDGLQAMLNAASLTVAAERGVRVLSDYLPARISRVAEYEKILALERKLGSRREFVAMARYTHCLARRSHPGMEGCA
jgi:S-adenosylmethionine-dependent methyltransferase